MSLNEDLNKSNKNAQDLNETLSATDQAILNSVKSAAQLTEQSRSLTEELKDQLGIRSRQTEGDRTLLGISRDITRSSQENKATLGKQGEIEKQLIKEKKQILAAQREQVILSKTLSSEEIKQANKISNVVKTQQLQLSKVDELKAQIANQEGKATTEQLSQLAKSEKILFSTEKEVAKQLEGATVESQRLALSNQLVKSAQDNIAASKEELKTQEQINELMGLGGASVEAIGGALDKLGMGGLKNALGLNEVQDEMRSIAEERLKEIKKGLKEGEEATLSFGDKMKVLKGGVKEAGAQLIKNLKDPLAIAGFLATQLVDALMSVDKQSGALAKNFGISNSQALALNSKLNTTANLSGELMVTTANLNESLITLNNRYGTFSSLNSKTLTDFTKLTKQAYLSNEAAGALQDTTFLTGKELEESTKEFLGQSAALAAQNGLALNQKQILESVKDVSTATLLQLQGQPEALAEAVVSAKALGLSLDKVEQISSSLLNFESSISAEMEAELLTGKQLNLEKARQAALDGDIATVAEEIAKQVGTAAEFTEMNVIQQEALAKSVGLTRDDLAKSLMEREAMAKISDQEGKTAQEKFNNLVKEVGLEEAKKRLGDESLANLYSQKNTQDKFNAAVEKLKEVFVSLAGPVMQIVSPIVDLLVPAISAISFLLTPVFDVFKGIGGMLTLNFEHLDRFQIALGAIAVAAGVVFSITKGIAFYNGLIETYQIAQLALENAKKGSIFGTIGAMTVALGVQLGLLSASLATNAAVTFGVGVAIAVAAAAAGYAAIKSMTADDMVSSPSGYGSRTLMGPEGAIALNDKDTVIAGTSLFDGGGEKMESSSNNNTSININPLVERMSAVENVLIQILNKEGDVYIDGAKVGKTVALASSNLG